MSGGTSRLTVEPAAQADVPAAVESLADAFASDPLMDFLFGAHPAGRRASTIEFFGLLMRVRIALAMPALLLKDGGRIAGAAMGYDATRPEWPYDAAWSAFEAGAPGLHERFETYEDIAVLHRPTTLHYYLGVIGVHPSMQGRGAGKVLLDAFCRLSADDTASSGVYLETASASSLNFYQRNGFILCGEGDLDGRPLWCVFRST